MLRTCLRRHFEYVVVKNSLPRQWNKVLDDTFVATFLRQLSLQIQLRQHVLSQIMLLRPIICDNVLATTCHRKNSFYNDFQVFATTFCSCKKPLLK